MNRNQPSSSQPWDRVAAATIGVVIIGRNEGERLVACLRSVAILRFPTVYVDSASSDGSQTAARSAGAHVVDLDLTCPFTAARARGEGVEALLSISPKLEYIQFIDGDCTLDATWISVAHHFLDRSPVYAVACGRRRELHPTETLYNSLADIEWNTPIGDADACGGDSLVRVSAYLAIGGFDPLLIAGEEPELCLRLRAEGWRIRRLDAEMTVHDSAMTRFSQWWKRAVRSGFGYAQTWRITRGSEHPLYRRELQRAVYWTLLPIALSAAAGLAMHPTGWLLAPMLYTAQIARLAGRFGLRRTFSWQRAALLTLSKPAEMWGAIRYLGCVLTGDAAKPIIHK